MGRPLKHPGAVRAAAFRADGKAVLTGCDDGLGRLWDVSPEAEADFPLPDPQEVVSAAFSPDAQALVVGGAGGTARQWAASTGRPWPGEPLRHSEAIQAVAFSPDGSLVLTGSLDGTARLWRASGRRPNGSVLLHQGVDPRGRLQPRRPDPCDQRRRQRRRLLLGPGDGKALPPTRRPGKENIKGWCKRWSSAPTGSVLLAGTRDGTVRLWQLSGGDKRPWHVLPNPQGNWSAAFSPDGKTCVTGSGDGTAQRWAVDTGKPIGPPVEPGGRVMAVAFSPDGRTFLTGSADGGVRLWQTATGKAIGPCLRSDGPVVAVAFSPDGKTLRMSDGQRSGARPPRSRSRAMRIGFVCGSR